ncbi:MAG: hypothetical protein A3J48_02385 [Candidatus Doudnabacteria bacterium RIFCSPHIGHO2_02_FULL_46_11]|uniref:Nudix hydrolase domain-containing protein n=1 Tax=Candidatus Doudnabacteria bacterium RIFCSPHIGHO2_02_FULL_46_11 TaxID=1817832 RepID=A0A1F5P9D1_9BACT|nr:MAG: hypothetical protein A3J48_02385 [Candidatus Doudnabacteria bacterium RIFCSPHIGHO2_02_FULL_46_11]
MTSDDIVIDRVDENDRVLGPISRKNIYRENASFRTSHIFVFNSKGELLLQKLASTRERYPGKWGSSVAGYVISGESYEQAAKRKLMDELGVSSSGAKLQTIGKTFIQDEGRKKFITLYRTDHDGGFKPDSEQIDEVKFFALKKIEEMRKDNPDEFTPNFLYLLDFYTNQKK